jgi:putative Mg2+ transporter-C (MgtC) family protein
MNLDPQAIIILEVAFAILLGGLLGVERELADKPAGFRTHMLVAGAACLLVGLAELLVSRSDIAPNPETVRADPVRIIEAIVTGISFLGAGTIFRSSDKDRVEGLTTAGSILFCAAVGICVALRQFWLAIGATVLALVVLRGMTAVEKWVESRGKP